MNPMYMNQGSGMRPPSQGPIIGQQPPQGMPGQNMYSNGPPQQQRPPGPGGYGPPPGKGGMPPQQYGAPPMQNGSFPGPQGPPQQQFGGQPPRGPPGQPPSQFPQGQMRGPPPQHGQRGPPPPNSTDQLGNQMGAMNIGGPNQQFRGPSPMGNMPGQTPNSMSGPPQRGPPPSSMGRPPPSSMGGQPPSSMSGGMGPPPSMGGAPPSSMGGPPPSSMSGHMGSPPSSMGGPPPSSMSSGMGPPSSMGGPPPSSMSSGMGPPPSMGGPPPMGGMRPPQTSMGGMPPPPSSMGGMQPPPSSMGGMPPSSMSEMPPSGMGGMPPSSMGGMPPSSMGGMQPPPPSMAGMGPPPTSSMAGMPPGPMNPPQGGGQQQYGQYNQPGVQPPHFQQQPGMPSGPPTPTHGPPPPGQGQNFQQGAHPGYHAQNQRPAPQPSQPRRLDPDQMPSPIQVIEDDRRNRKCVFQTNTRGAVPPLVTTDFITEDQGNCNPKFIRSTMYNIPCTSDIVKQAQIPIGLTINPFSRLDPKEMPPPLVNLGELGPVRCNRCKAYMNPNMQFIDGGRRFQCCFCTCTSEVPAEYFAHLDHTGRRVDCYDRPELYLGSYEYVATKEYCRNNQFPKPPAFVFMIDVSYHAVKCGLVHLICEKLKNDILVNLPKEAGMDESEIRVGFATYSNVIHFYNVKGCLAQPQMLVVSDVQDVFVPLVDGFLVKLSEAEGVIDSLLEEIPLMFAETRETETILGPVIQAGLDALKSAECVGKLYIFHTSLPIAEAPGKLKNRDDRKLLGTDKEKTILAPSNNFYTKLGQECVAAGCGVDMFLFPNSYIDVATIGEVSRMTGGQVYKYTYFQADIDGERFIADLRNNVQRPIGFDAIMRVRTSTGIRPTDFLGNFYMSNTTDVELATIDSDKAITLEIKHDDKLSESDGAHIQAAILYTSITGQRRLRVHNLALNCCVLMADLFRNVELDTMINFISKQALRDVLKQSPKVVRENIMNQCASILACYRKNCASPSSAGQLILPECMKLLPLYSNCVIKNDGLQGASDVSTDDRSYLMQLVNSMDVSSSCVFFYPRLLPLHNLDPNTDELPSAVRCSIERLQEDGAYLLENGISMFIWIGHNISQQWVQEVFGVQSVAQIDIDKSRLLDLDSPMSQRVRGIIRKVCNQRNRFMKLTIVRQRDKLEPWFQHFLVEDKGQSNNTASYVEYLCHIHKEIRQHLS